MSCNEASNEINQGTDHSQNWKIIKNNIFKNYKNSKMAKKCQNIKKKSHVRRPQVKKIRKQSIGRIGKYSEYNIKTF